MISGVSGHNYTALADVTSAIKMPQEVKMGDENVILNKTTPNATAIADLESAINTHDAVYIQQSGKTYQIAKDDAKKILSDLKAHTVSLADIHFEVSKGALLDYIYAKVEHLAHSGDEFLNETSLDNFRKLVVATGHSVHYEHMALEFGNIMRESASGHLAVTPAEIFAHIKNAKGGEKIFGKFMVGLGIVAGGAQAWDYANRFKESLKNGDGDAAYNAMQALLGGGSAIPGPIGFACACVSEMLKAKEGQGLFKDYVLDNIHELAEANNKYKLGNEATLQHTEYNWMQDPTDRDHYGDNLVKDKGGFKTQESALAYIKEQQQSWASTLYDRADYAITKEGNGSFTVNLLKSNFIIGRDISNRQELERITLNRNNEAHVVAVVGDDGSYGIAKKVPINGGESNVWNIVYQKNILD